MLLVQSKFIFRFKPRSLRDQQSDRSEQAATVRIALMSTLSDSDLE